MENIKNPNIYLGVKYNQIMNKNNNITDKDVIDEVCKYYDTTLKEILLTKKAEVVEVRRIIIYFLRQITKKNFKKKYSLTYVGKIFNKDHATVLYHVRKIKDFLEYDKRIQRDISIISEKLNLTV